MNPLTWPFWPALSSPLGIALTCNMMTQNSHIPFYGPLGDEEQIAGRNRPRKTVAL